MASTKTTGRDVQLKNSGNVRKLAEGNLEFALNLYQAILNEHGDANIFCSPFSVTAALAMAYAGARGKTADEMRSLMKLDDVDDVHSAIGEIQESLNLGRTVDQTLPFTLNCANRMYVHKSCPISDSYVSIVNDHYGAQPEKVNFEENADKTRQEINRWVEEVTRAKIKDLLAPGLINAMTRMVLVNAIYFKGKWSDPFDPNKTKEDDFFVMNDDKTRVQMMFTKGKFPYAENKALKCKILELPYSGDRLSMYVILPEAIEGLQPLEKQLTASIFNDMKSKVVRGIEVVVRMPRFRLESTVPLSETLHEMGVRDLFSERAADLSGITGNRDLHVSAVIHKAFVDVNEEGTEAAAATAVVMMRMAVINRQVHEFTADHPFLFVIYDKHTELVLFVGRLKRPE